MTTRLVDPLYAAALAVLFGGWSVWLLVLAGDWPAATVPVIVGHAVLVWRRSKPLVCLAVATASAAVEVFALGLPVLLPSLVVFPVALFSWVAYGPRRAGAYGLVVALACAAVLFLGSVFVGRPMLPGIPVGWICVFALAIALTAWSLGLTRRFQLASAAALAGRAARAEAEKDEQARQAVVAERARIAREMHDVVSHSVSVMVSQALGGQYAARGEPVEALETVREVLDNIASTGRHALADMRAMLQVLRTDGESDEPHSQPTLAEIPGLLDRVRAGGLTVDFAQSGTPVELTPAAELAVFRLVQEALTNTLKHAGESAGVWLSFNWSAGGLAVVARDDGGGRERAMPAGGGQGLIGMTERITAVGGTVTAGAADGGFVVRATVPAEAGR
jgi:signal transduction histidine kinase